MERVFDFIGNTDDGVFAVDANQRIVLWNEGACRMLAFLPDDVIGAYCYELLRGTDEEGCAVCGKGCMAIQAAARGEIVGTREVQFETKTGPAVRLSLTTILLPSRWRELSVLAHVFRDLSCQKWVERKHEELLAGLGQIAPNSPRAFEDAPACSSIAETLTPRECEILRFLMSGTSTDAIAGRLDICRTTVRTHVQRVLRKLGVHTRLEAVALAARRGLP